MTLRVERLGKGPNLVLLHGWALNSGIWQTYLPMLTQHYCVHLVDLPGHGVNHAETLAPNVTVTAAQLIEALPAQSHWLGWSLGGTVALAAALIDPTAVNKLILVATTPRFVATETWLHGLPRATFELFAQQLEDDYESTLKRFLALQALGLPHAQHLITQLTRHVLERPQPALTTLRNGLAVLNNTDLVAQVPRIGQPTLVMHGNKDRLIPFSAGQYLASTIAHAQLVPFQNAGHAPFLGHDDVFLRAIQDFLHDD